MYNANVSVTWISVVGVTKMFSRSNNFLKKFQEIYKFFDSVESNCLRSDSIIIIAISGMKKNSNCDLT